MNKLFLGFILFFCFSNISAQNVLDRKFSGGLIFSGIFIGKELTEKTISSDLGEGYFETEKLPTFGVGFFLEYYINKHSFGLSQQSAIYNWEYGGIYNDSIDSDFNYLYSERFSDYTEYKFNNFFAFYRYSFIIANLQPSLKLGVGYHNVKLSGYGHYSYYEFQTSESFYEEMYDQATTNYFSVKPEFEVAFRFSRHMSVFAFVAYDFALGDDQKYSYDYDEQLIDKGYVTEISRAFNPPNYFELSLGIAFSF